MLIYIVVWVSWYWYINNYIFRIRRNTACRKNSIKNMKYRPAYKSNLKHARALQSYDQCHTPHNYCTDSTIIYINGAPPVNRPHALIYLNWTQDDNGGGARGNSSLPLCLSGRLCLNKNTQSIVQVYSLRCLSLLPSVSPLMHLAHRLLDGGMGVEGKQLCCMS